MINYLLGAVLVAVVALAARKVYKDKKTGGCGCGCSGCASAKLCHPKK